VTKLPLIDPLDLIKYLSKRGFNVVHVNGSHHVLKSNNRFTTVPFHRGQQIGRGLLLAILEEAGITKEEFLKDWYG